MRKFKTVAASVDPKDIGKVLLVLASERGPQNSMALLLACSVVNFMALEGGKNATQRKRFVQQCGEVYDKISVASKVKSTGMPEAQDRMVR